MIYIHIALSVATVLLFSVAFWNSATLSGEKMSKAFVGTYVLVSIAFATVSLAAIITAFQVYNAYCCSDVLTFRCIAMSCENALACSLTNDQPA